MKKQLKKLLILIISIFTIPIIAKADMGTPILESYEVIVTNTKGAIVYDTDGKKTGDIIPYDTKLKASYEHKIGNKIYIDFYTPEETGLDIDGIILLSDIQVFNPEIDFSKFPKSTKQIKFYTIAETDLYKGPASAYGKVENVKIPAETRIDYTYEFRAEDYELLWIYTEYNGTKGWVYVHSYVSLTPHAIECTVARKSSGKILITSDRNIIDNSGNVIGKVKKSEEYEYTYITNREPKAPSYYIKKDNIEGWVSGDNNGLYTEGISEETEIRYLALEKDGMAIFEDSALTKKVEKTTIPYGTEITTTYCIDTHQDSEDEDYEIIISEICEIKYNNKNYWALIDDETSIKVAVVSDSRITTQDETEMYKNHYDDEALKIKIPADISLEPKWESFKEDEDGGNWYYVEYENQKGWIYIAQDNVEEPNDDVNSEDQNANEENEKVKEETEEKTLTPKQTAYIAIGTAALLAVGALFTILLINKNKKNKKENEEKIVEEATPVVEETKEPKETDNETK